MSKKVQLQCKYAAYGAIVLGVIAICMIFLTAIVYKVGDSVTNYTGLQAVFGYTQKNTVLATTVSTELLKFSFMNLLPYILLLAGVVLVALKSFAHMGGKLFALIAAACFVVAGILLFTTVASSVVGTSSIGSATIANLDKSKMALGAGPIIGAILAFLAAVCEGGDFVLGK